MPYTETERRQLWQCAQQSIAHGLQTGRPLKVDVRDYPESLTAWRASFVTLQKNGQLRGCIGMLQATRPLIEDVAENAFAAAFRDPRFPPVTADEFPHLDIHLSLLSAPEPIHFSSEADLLQQLRPGVDGLILSDGARRGTFLPSVWENLPTPRDFLRHLKRKAGLPMDYWSDSLRVERYTTESIAGP